VAATAADFSEQLLQGQTGARTAPGQACAGDLVRLLDRPLAEVCPDLEQQGVAAARSVRQ
jgi:hypothetical protein